jgi:hypothetical protein
VARDSLGPTAGEMSLLPGFALYGLAVAGLIYSVWSLRTRLLLLGGVVLSIILAMGTKFLDGGRPGYMTLYDILPGWDSIRTPGRLVLWTTLLLGLLAAGAVSAFAERAKEVSKDRVPARSHPILAIAMLIPVALVLVGGAQQLDWATDHFPQLVNGGSGFTPTTLSQVREITKAFPDQASVEYLRSLGVKEVVVLKGYVNGSPYENALTATGDGLGIEREERDDAVVFKLG